MAEAQVVAGRIVRGNVVGHFWTIKLIRYYGLVIIQCFLSTCLKLRPLFSFPILELL